MVEGETFDAPALSFLYNSTYAPAKVAMPNIAVMTSSAHIGILTVPDKYRAAVKSIAVWRAMARGYSPKCFLSLQA